jgi:UMF1 family MFS transporter
MKYLAKGSPKLVHAWAFYDWANSVYSLVIASTIFPIFYGALFRQKGTDEIVFAGLTIQSDALIPYVTAF